MPNKTLYVRESDIPLFERAQDQLGDSVSSLFAEFLREKADRLMPEEARILRTIDALQSSSATVARDPGVPGFVAAGYAEAAKMAQKALDSLRSREVRQAKVYYWAALALQEKADRDVKELRQILARVEELLASPNG